MIGKSSPTLFKHELLNVSFLVVDTKLVPILGLESCKNLKFIKRICSAELKENLFLSEFLGCFGDIGTLNETYHIEVKNFTPDVTFL